MNKPKEISEKEVKEIANGILDVLRPIVSKISDEKIPKRFKKKDLKDFGNSIKWLSEIGQMKSEIDAQTLPVDFKTKKQFQIMDTLLRGFFGTDIENPSKLMVDEGDPKILYARLLKSETKAKEFQKNIHDIYYKIGKLGKMPQFEEFQQSLGIDTFISHTQSAERFNKHAKYLLKDRKRFSKRIVERHVDIFKEVSGHLETLIIILYGMNLIIQNKYKSFKDIRNKYSIGIMVRELKKLDLFSPLINAYNPHIRNSIHHSTYQLDVLEKKIEFTDRKYTKIMTFSDFVNYVQEIGILGMMLSRIEYELNYLKFVEYQKYRESLFRN